LTNDEMPAIGLDFGTSTTLVASRHGVVPIGESFAWMPSVVGHEDDGTIVVGERALDVPEERALRSIKRAITDGRKFVYLDTPAGVRDVRADDLIAQIVREAARRAGEHGQNLTAEALRLGCPAMWDGAQRRRLVDAARRAGLPATLNNLVDEPVAAGIAWLAGRPASPDPLRVLVFDMGGGTLDIAVLDVRGADVSVLAALGVAEAGDTLDEAIAEDLEYALAAAGVAIGSLPSPRRARARLPHAAQTAKVLLSTSAEVDVKLPRREFGIASLPYTREQLNTVFAPQLDRAEVLIAAALRVARLTEHASATAYDIARAPMDELASGVDVVVLSGGMSQIPYVAQRMRELFPVPTRIAPACAPSENAVALGLARATRYGGINMYRPAFDILLEWDEGRECRTVYEAYTPLIEARQIVQGGGDLRFIRTGTDLRLPSAGTGRLRLVSHAADGVRAVLGGSTLDGFPVALSEQKFEFSIYPHGRIRMTDAAGTYDGQLQGSNLSMNA
jgi:molecular chaperone DnaK (HSP70)